MGARLRRCSVMRVGGVAMKSTTKFLGLLSFYSDYLTTVASDQMNNLKGYCYRHCLRVLSQWRGDTELVLGAVIYQIGPVSATTLDGFCIVIGLKTEDGRVIGRRTESCRDSRVEKERFYPIGWSGLSGERRL